MFTIFVRNNIPMKDSFQPPSNSVNSNLFHILNGEMVQEEKPTHFYVELTVQIQPIHVHSITAKNGSNFLPTLLFLTRHILVDNIIYSFDHKFIY